MSIFLGIFVSLVVFSIIVLVHEFGHFKAARIFGVKVEEFGLGIPPRAKKLWQDKKGTLYSLNWLPLGGFVRLKGENPYIILVYTKTGKILAGDDIEKYLENHGSLYSAAGEKIPSSQYKQILERIEDTHKKDNLHKASFMGQLCIIFAGVTMNFLLAILIFWGLFLYGVHPLGINSKIPTSIHSYLIPTYEQALGEGIIIKNPGVKLFPLPGSISQAGGIQDGDIVIKINNVPLSNPNEFIEQMKNSNESVYLEILRKEEIIFINLLPDSNKKIGSYVGENITYNEDFKYKFGIFGSLQAAISETANQSALTFKALYVLGKKIISPEKPQERTEAIDELSGPIGVVGIMTQALDQGFILIMILGAIISINLGVFNLLPIPALDGGRGCIIIINTCVEKVFGKKILSFGVESLLHIGFLILLVALSVYIGYNDTVKLIK